jgi:hypothetical protein
MVEVRVLGTGDDGIPRTSQMVYLITPFSHTLSPNFSLIRVIIWLSPLIRVWSLEWLQPFVRASRQTHKLWINEVGVAPLISRGSRRRLSIRCWM